MDAITYSLLIVTLRNLRRNTVIVLLKKQGFLCDKVPTHIFSSDAFFMLSRSWLFHVFLIGADYFLFWSLLKHLSRECVLFSVRNTHGIQPVVHYDFVHTNYHFFLSYIAVRNYKRHKSFQAQRAIAAFIGTITHMHLMFEQFYHIEDMEHTYMCLLLSLVS